MKNTIQVPEDLRAGVLDMLTTHGEARTSHLLHLSRTTIGRVLGRDPVRRATVTHLRHVLVGLGMVKPEPPRVPEPAPYRPVGEFVLETCDVDPRRTVGANELHAAWVRWCTARGEAATELPLFGRDLKAALGLRMSVARPRTSPGRGRVYLGIGLKPGPTT